MLATDICALILVSSFNLVLIHIIESFLLFLRGTCPRSWCNSVWKVNTATAMPRKSLLQETPTTRKHVGWSLNLLIRSAGTTMEPKVCFWLEILLIAGMTSVIKSEIKTMNECEVNKNCRLASENTKYIKYFSTSNRMTRWTTSS